MIRLVLFACTVYFASGQLLPVIYAAPSAVSHQSRVDIVHSPGFISGPLIYSPSKVIYEKQVTDAKTQEAVLTPMFAADTILTPVALSFFHNLPLARALEHPISLDKVQEENEEKYYLENKDKMKVNGKGGYEKGEVIKPDNEKLQIIQLNDKQNYVIVEDDEVNTDIPIKDGVRET